MLALAIACAVGCSPGKPTAAQVLQDYVAAVQDEDLRALRCLLAGASPGEEDTPELRADFEAWAAERYRTYETGRDRGGVAFDEEGMLLVKTFGLGIGTYYTVQATRHDGDQLLADTAITFGYREVDYSALSPGTTFYLAGWPAGRIEAIQVPSSPDSAQAEVLERIFVRWTFVRERADALCPQRWSALSAALVPDTESVTDWTVEWR